MGIIFYLANHFLQFIQKHIEVTSQCTDLILFKNLKSPSQITFTICAVRLIGLVTERTAKSRGMRIETALESVEIRPGMAPYPPNKPLQLTVRCAARS